MVWDPSLFKLPHSDQNHPVARNGGFEFTFKKPEIFLPPQISDDLLSGTAQVGPFGGNCRLSFAAIEQADGFAAILTEYEPASSNRKLDLPEIWPDTPEPCLPFLMTRPNEINEV